MSTYIFQRPDEEEYLSWFPVQPRITDSDRLAYIRECAVARGYIPEAITRVILDARATNAEFDRAVDKAVERYKSLTKEKL